VIGPSARRRLEADSGPPGALAARMAVQGAAEAAGARTTGGAGGKAAGPDRIPGRGPGPQGFTSMGWRGPPGPD
jgi:hypothetical protein